MAVPIPVEWRCDVDQQAAQIRDVLDKQPDVVAAMRERSLLGCTLANWGMGIAANILNAEDEHQRQMRAWAWIETLESFR